MATLRDFAGGDANGNAATNRWAPTWGPPDEKTKKRPYILAGLPEQGDSHGLCWWLTLSLGLDPNHPIVRGHRFGTHDTDGNVILVRADAPPLRFAPITATIDRHQAPRIARQWDDAHRSRRAATDRRALPKNLRGGQMVV